LTGWPLAMGASFMVYFLPSQGGGREDFAGMIEMTATVRPTQVDTFGHMNHAAYLEVFEWARWEWAAARGMDMERMAAEDRIGPAVLHVDLSFTKELRMHDPVRVRTWVESLERVKGVMGQEMVRADGAVAALMFLTFAIFHLDRRRVVALPESLRAAFEADADYRAQRSAARARRPYRRPGRDQG